MVSRVSAEWVRRERRAVEAAVARADSLIAAGCKCEVRLMAQGAEVRIEQASARRGCVSVSWEVFPF